MAVFYDSESLADSPGLCTIRTVSPGKPAVFVVSIDLEMSWGTIHHGRPHISEHFSNERQIVRDVLDMMEKYGIAGTWAIVGHLFLSTCAPEHGIKHTEIIRPHYEWHPADWYEMDPSSDVEHEPTWYAPDLVEAIRDCSMPQEIASHSFGHIIAGDPGCDREAFRSDLAACVSVAKTENIDLRSFVFPRNSIDHVEILEEEGFSAFRGRPPDRLAHLPVWLRKLFRLIDTISPRSSSGVWPSHSEGLVNVPQTYFFDPNSAVAKRLGGRAWSWLVRRRLRHAIRIGSLFHVWFHTHNLGTHPDRGYRALEDLLREVRREIENGRLENLTMGALAGRWS